MASILVVDDEPDIRNLMAYSLGVAGHEVATEADGNAGLEVARATIPDLVVLDWMMPGKDGIEVCLALRAEAAFAETLIVILTARTQQKDVERALSAGADAYIVKPFSPREMVERITTLLAR